MNEEYIVERSKSIAVKNIFISLLGILLMALVLILPVNKIADSEGKALFLKVFKVFVVLIIPILVLTLISHVKYLLSNEPILVINEQGITDRTHRNKTIGPILWEDILFIKVIPYMDNLVYISLKLKDPYKYVKPSISRLFNNPKYSLDVNIYSLYFKGQEQAIIDLINEYLEKNKKNND